jgi:predicted dehydrogenase
MSVAGRPKLRLGVIGAGSWAVSAHLPALAARRDQVEFVAVCRKGAEALARVKQRFGFAIGSEDFRDVIAAGIDICVVSSPAASHYEQAAAALQAGCHVLCEKPMTIDPSEAWSLVDVARQADRQLLISFGWNFIPMIRATKELVDRYGIGSVEQASVQMSSPTRELLGSTGVYPDAAPDTAPEARTWIDPAISGGGYGQAQLTHGLGLAFHFIPERAKAAFAMEWAPPGAPVEFHNAISLRLEGGGIASVSGASAHLGAAANKHALEVRLIGSEGQLLVDVQREVAWLYREDGVDEKIAVQEGDGAYNGHGPANALVDVALGLTANDCAPGELGARVVEALALAYRSAGSGQVEVRV